MTIGPSTTTPPDLVGHEPNVTFVALLARGDTFAGGDLAGFAGSPDGLGAFDNGDGTATVIVNHEIEDGASIDALVIDRQTLAVVSGGNAVSSVRLWDGTGFVSGTTTFSRLCSGDLAVPSAWFDPESGHGTKARIWLTGEENGPEGRAFATVVTGKAKGTAFELPALGNMSFENLTANPVAQALTIVAATDDGLGGQVYLYVGTKHDKGTVAHKAGLADGALYGIAVTGVADETGAVPAEGRFVLAPIGEGGDVRAMSGAQIDAASELAGVTSFLRPEDSAWDPDHPDTLYFTTTNTIAGPSRLYRVTFDDIANPTAGGSIEAVLDGSEGQRKLDNLTIGNGRIILQEDPGNNARVAQVWQYDIATDRLLPVAGFDPARFTPGADALISQDEESSGVVDVTALFGDAMTRAYLLDTQVALAGENGLTGNDGQLLLMRIAAVRDGGAGNDVLNGDGLANVIRGRGGHDLIRGGSAADVLRGGTGNDDLRGGRGDDTLIGNGGNDRLLGGSGRDVLAGGMGDDLLKGGSGADRFVFGTNGDGQVVASGHDTIADFRHGEDTLALPAELVRTGELHGDFNADGRADTQLVFNDGATLTLLGVVAIAPDDLIVA